MPSTATSRRCSAFRRAIEPGETVAIIGSNGAGKSTFLKAITGMLLVGARGDPLRRRGDRRAAGARDHEARHRHGAGGPQAVPVAHRRGESADRRLWPHRLGPLVAEDALRAVSDPRRTAQQPVDGAVRRPAADGGDRPRADVEPEAAALRRDFARPGAGGHPRHLRRASGDQGGGHRRSSSSSRTSSRR